MEIEKKGIIETASTFEGGKETGGDTHFGREGAKLLRAESGSVDKFKSSAAPKSTGGGGEGSCRVKAVTNRRHGMTGAERICVPAAGEEKRSLCPTTRGERPPCRSCTKPRARGKPGRAAKTVNTSRDRRVIMAQNQKENQSKARGTGGEKSDILSLATD